MDSRTLTSQHLVRLSGIASLFVICLSGVVLSGWLLNIPELQSILPGFPTMKFNTGLCFLLSGLSLFCWHRNISCHDAKSATLIQAATATATIGLFLAAITLSQYLFNWNSGLDTLFYKASVTDAAPPGRMSGITAFNFILTDLALFLLAGKKMFSIVVQLLALITAVIASLILLAYLFNANLVLVPWFSSIAIHTACCFWILGAGILALVPGQGFMEEFTQDTNTANLSRWFLLSTMLVMPLIAGLRIIGQETFHLYDTAFGIAILTVASITTLSVITWFRTRMANRFEIEIANLNRVYAVLSGINTLIVRTKSREALFREACDIAHNTGHFPWTWIVSFDHEHQQLSLAATAGGNQVLRDTLQANLLTMINHDPHGDSPLQEVITTGKPLVMNDLKSRKNILERFPQADHVLLAFGIRSFVMLPLKVDGKVTSVFSLNADSKDYFDDREMNLLNELSGDISFALSNLAKEELLNYLSYYDPLTELANRSYFISMLGKEISNATRNNANVTLVLFDIKRFRMMNDSLGRTTGDEILKLVAQRLFDNVPQPESLARLHSDCFAMFISTGNKATANQVISRQLLGIMDDPFVIRNESLQLKFTMGIAIFPADGEDQESLLKNAEAALKKAKDSEQSFLFYEPDINASVAESFKLETRLRSALELDQFVLHYQPKITFGTTIVNSVEALIRWQDPDRGLVPPGMFIPLLEETGLILQVGEWAMKQAVRDIKNWQNMGLKPPRVAVNVSSVQLREKNFTGTVVNLLTEIDDEEPLIDLELTESLIMQNIQHVSLALKTLRNLGVEISIDDFGTGYSSLSYLARLPINMLKIDRSFVLGMTKDDDGIALIGAIISLAHSLNLGVIAEGVETREQANILQDLHCDQMQGYLFSKPVPFDELAGMLPSSSKEV